MEANVLIGQGAELPNVKAVVNTKANAGLLSVPTGAFEDTGERKIGYISFAPTGSNYLEKLGFNASKGQTNSDGTTYKTESVYRDGGEVRTQNLAVRYWTRTA